MAEDSSSSVIWLVVFVVCLFILNRKQQREGDQAKTMAMRCSEAGGGEVVLKCDQPLQDEILDIADLVSFLSSHLGMKEMKVL